MTTIRIGSVTYIAHRPSLEVWIFTSPYSAGSPDRSVSVSASEFDGVLSDLIRLGTVID